MRKGFTLIEVLAVLVITAVITIITTPIVLSAINSANISSKKISVSNIAKVGEEYFMRHVSEMDTFDYDQDLFSQLEFKGERPDIANVYINQNGNVSISAVYDNHCYTKEFQSDEIIVSDDINNCVVEPLPIPPDVCFEFNTSTRTIEAYYGYEAYNSSDYPLPAVNYVDCVVAFEIPDNIEGVPVEHIGYWAAPWTELVEVVLPDTITSIEENAFYGNYLTSITIPSSVTIIGEGAFYDNLLEEVTFNEGLINIGFASFGANSLTTVNIPNSVTTIQTSAFEDNLLTYLEIGTGVTSIGTYAFSGNYLTHENAIIRRNSGTVTIAANAFSYNGLDGNTTITPTYNP
jgi:prepilin-type N-terminal cleavage/methylation domain-containing protein